MKLLSETDVDVHYVDKDINTDLSNINFDKYSNLIEMEKSLKLKDKELKNRESTIKKKETELNEALLKLSTAQAYIVKLEKNVNDLKQFKNLSSRVTSTSSLKNNDMDAPVSGVIQYSKMIEMEKRIEVLENKLRHSEGIDRDRNIVINNNISDGKCSCNNQNQSHTKKSQSSCQDNRNSIVELIVINQDAQEKTSNSEQLSSCINTTKKDTPHPMPVNPDTNREDQYFYRIAGEEGNHLGIDIQKTVITGKISNKENHK